MKILFIAPRFHTNQAEVVNSLVKNGHYVSFHCVLRGAIENYSLINPVLVSESRISRVIRQLFGDGGANQKRFFPSIIGYWNTLRKEAPDIVIIRLHGYVFNYMAAFYACLVGARIIFYDQLAGDMLAKYLESGWKSQIRKTLFYGRLIMFRSAWMTPLCSPDKISQLPPRCYYVPFAVPLIYHPNSKPQENPLRFLMVGKYQARKNHLLLLESAKILACNHEFHITMIGECSTSAHEHIRSLVEQSIIHLGLEEYITIEEPVPHSQINALYSDHDVFVLPASNEPASVSVLEALGCGLPVICSDTCGTKSYIMEGYNGFIFDSNSSLSLATKMHHILADKKMTSQMSSNAYKYAKQYISSDFYYSRFAYLLSDHYGYKIGIDSLVSQ